MAVVRVNFLFPPSKEKKPKSQETQGVHSLPGIWLLNTVMDPNSKGLCRTTVKENTINHACVYKTSCLCSLFFLPLCPSPPHSWPKGVSMQALLHDMIRNGKKKFLCWFMYSPELPELSISLDSLLQWGHRKNACLTLKLITAFAQGS